MGGALTRNCHVDPKKPRMCKRARRKERDFLPIVPSIRSTWCVVSYGQLLQGLDLCARLTRD